MIVTPVGADKGGTLFQGDGVVKGIEQMLVQRYGETAGTLHHLWLIHYFKI